MCFYSVLILSHLLTKKIDSSRSTISENAFSEDVFGRNTFVLVFTLLCIEGGNTEIPETNSTF